MKIEMTSIDSVKGSSKNPRVIKDDKFKMLVQSIKDFPEMLRIRPIVVDDDMVVLGGNQRLKACRAAGLKEIPIIKASELTEDQKREFVIKDNVSAGDWDIKKLDEGWGDLPLDFWGIDESKNDVMPTDRDPGECSIVIYFESQDDREDFCVKAPISVSKKVGKKWNAKFVSNDLNLF